MPKWLHKHKGSPYWQYEFRVAGRQLRGSTGTADLSTAKKFVLKLHSQAVLGLLNPRPASMTVDQAFAKFQTEVADRLREGPEVLRRLARLITFFGPQRQFADIKTQDLTDYRHERQKAPDGRRKAAAKGQTVPTVSPRTINLEIETYRRVWRHARDAWELELGREPLWRKIRLAEPAGRTRYLLPREESALLPALPADLAVLIRFAAIAGARLSSCIKLEWRDVDERITFRGVKSRRPDEAHSIPCVGELPALLDLVRDQHPTFVFTWQRQRRGKNVVKGDRQPFTKDGWRKRWKVALAAAGITDFRFHDLRHTAATRILAITGNLLVARDLLGHDDLESTQRYAHVLDRALAEGMEKANPRNGPGIETGEAGPSPVSSSSSNT